MRALKIAGGVGAGVLIILILSLGALAVGGGPVLAWVFEHPVSRLAERHVSIDGPVTIRWGAPTRIVAENIRIANARWGSRPDMLVAQRIEIDVAPGTLLGAAWRVPRVSIEHALLVLEAAPDGQHNWDFVRALLPSDGGAAWAPPPQIMLRDGTFLFRDGSGTERRLVAESLVVDAAERTAPIQLQAAGTVQQQPIHLAGSIGPLGELLRPTRPYPLALDAQFGGSDLRFRGTAAAPLALAGIDGSVRLDGQRLDELAAAFGLALPPLPAFHAQGRLTGGAGDWEFSALSVELGQSDVEGSVTLSTRGPLPHASADLTSRLIDLDDLAGVIGAVRSRAAATSRTSGADRRLIPETAVAPRLDGVNLDVMLRGGRVAAGKGPPLEDVVMGLSVREGVLALAPLAFEIAGGTVAIDLTASSVPLAPALAVDIDVRHVDLARLSRRMSLPPFAQGGGIAGGFARVRSTGASVRDLLGGLEGDAGIFAANGAFSPGLQQLLHHDVLEALGLDGGVQAVPVNCLISRFNLKKGVVAASTLLLDTPDVALLGQGNVNFAAETIYVDITPHHKSVTPATVSTPVEVRGTYADATVRPATASIVERIGAAIEPGILPPPLALQPLADRALGENNSCATAFGTQKTEDVAVGSSRPPKK